MSIDFHNTGYGRDFFQRQLPDLIKSINELTQETKRMNDLKEKELQSTEAIRPENPGDYEWPGL